MKKYVNTLLNTEPDQTELISNFDLYKYFGKDLPIVLSTDFVSKDINELVENDFKSSVILIKGDFSNHWVLLSKINGNYEYFDSYGHSYKEDKELKDFFKNIPITFNKIRFQKMAPDVNTCGKHVAMRLLCLLCFKMDLKMFQRFMKSLKREFGGDYDNQVEIFVKL